MSNNNESNKLSKTRRGALKTAGTSAFAAVAATQLPGKWKQPVINTVILPAHALTSEVEGEGGELTTTPAATTPAATTTQATTTQATTTQATTTAATTTPSSSTTLNLN